jgi:hypothetical protein
VTVAIAYRATQNGYDVLSVTAAELNDTLYAVVRNSTLATAWSRTPT